MSELKPVAWSLEYNGTHVTADKSLAMSLKADGVPVAPLYAIPDGYVALPSVLNSNQIKKAAGHLMANGYDGISAAENVLIFPRKYRHTNYCALARRYSGKSCS